MSTTAQTHATRAMAYAFARNVASMQAAYIEWTRGDGADHGMAWIGNTLCGPGLLPDAGSATAQEFFDCEMEKLDKLYPDVTMNPALPSPAWCASVDAELAATAEADVAQWEIEHASCTLCAGLESPGFYTGCMIKDKAIPGGSDWSCDGRGNLARIKPASSESPTLPAAAVAEGAQLDGASLEQAS